MPRPEDGLKTHHLEKCPWDKFLSQTRGRPEAILLQNAESAKCNTPEDDLKTH